jgi:tetrapyrrole methylase family protein/MazG family protein
MSSPEQVRPRIDVVGLGPAGPELITEETFGLIGAAPALFLRTRRHPAAAAFPDAQTFDHHYERAGTFDEVYRDIVRDLVVAATTMGSVAYAVPGSPVVAERTVALLRDHPAVLAGVVELVVHASVSFLDLAFSRLGVDPVADGVRVIDGDAFAVEAAGQRGPLLVAQCWSTSVLSDIKLSTESAPADPVTVLRHLGLPDEQVWELPWDELDRSFVPDHLTSLWIPTFAAPVAAELVRLDELVHVLRQQCPWDREQTHGSLARHLLEESYEALEAIDALSTVDRAGDDGDGPGGTSSGRAGTGGEELVVAHLEEELGDLLFQVYFHAVLAAEEGRFTLADVARGVHDKLVSRHPHVFGDVVADTPEELAANWEAMKKSEKNRSSVTEGIPAALPALALVAKLQRKALAVGMALPDVSDDADRLTQGVSELAATGGDRGQGDNGETRADDADHLDDSGHLDDSDRVGELLFALVNLARSVGVDPETALRIKAASFRSSVETHG